METRQENLALLDVATCFLCRDLFDEPVTLTCGHNFCYVCILCHWSGCLRNACCPQCNEMFDRVIPRPNKQLGDIVSAIKQTQQPCETLPTKLYQCGVHKETATLFCKDDDIPLCSTCENSRTHKSHLVVPVEEAARAHKYEVKVHLGLLNIIQRNVSDFFHMLQEEQTVKKIIGNLGEMIAVDYKELQDIMKMIQMEQIDLFRAIEQEIGKEYFILFKKHNNMKQYLQDLEKMCKLPPVSQFLQSIIETMSRCRAEALTNPEHGPPVLTEKIWELALRNLSIKNTLKKCREGLLLKTVAEKENIILDPLTAHPCLKLSVDGKTVMYDPSSYNSVPMLQVFNTSLSVLGTEGFSSGLHCWEVELSSEGESWALGVVKEGMQLASDDVSTGFWALHPEDSPLLRHKEEIFCIRIYLDYEGAYLHFFRSPDRELIYTIACVSFLGETLFPFFRLGNGISRMKLCF